MQEREGRWGHEVGISQGPLAANGMNLGIKLLPNKLYTILFVILYRFRKSYASLCLTIGTPPFLGLKPPFFRYILKEKKLWYLEKICRNQSYRTLKNTIYALYSFELSQKLRILWFLKVLHISAYIQIKWIFKYQSICRIFLFQ